MRNLPAFIGQGFRALSFIPRDTYEQENRLEDKEILIVDALIRNQSINMK